MELIEIFKSIITEIGSIVNPPSATYSVSERKGSVKFSVSGEQYTIDIDVTKINYGTGAGTLEVDFDAGGTFALTNRNEMLKIMSYVFGGVSEWIDQYKQKYQENFYLDQIIYIPKAEDTEEDSTDQYTPINKRDRIYRYLIDKFATTIGAEVIFFRFDPNSDKIVAKFTYD